MVTALLFFVKQLTFMSTDHQENRKHYRQKLLNTLVVNKPGRCRILDLSLGGVSFGCIDKSDIPDRLVVDVEDDKGLHLIDLPVERVWVAESHDSNFSEFYDTIVGARFKNPLAPDQQATLNQLLVFFSKNNPM